MYFKKRSHSLNKIVKKNYTLKTFISRKKASKEILLTLLKLFYLFYCVVYRMSYTVFHYFNNSDSNSLSFSSNTLQA